ncbi:hypothetical protein [Shewanella maritima]|uniref:hypothetical protein n=1 Tax=Shewanella maritima TaxID=2520507 RepID=UPI003736FD00
MYKPSNLVVTSLVLLSTITAGCGGSSGGSDGSGVGNSPIAHSIPYCETDVQLITQTTQSDVIFSLESNYQVNQTSSIIAQLPDTDSHDYSFNWTQTAGTSLNLATHNSPVLSFSPTEVGNYQFEVTISNPSQTWRETVEITATDHGTTITSINLDHQVVSEGNVSLRVARVNNTAPDSISWCINQNELPRALDIDLTNPERPLFTVPSVSQDTLVSLRATVNLAGEQYTDDVHLLVSNTPKITSKYFDTPIAKVHAFRRDSPYADWLNRCVYNNQLTQSCPSNNGLPLIGQQTDTPSIDDIMDRVVVSHDWMAESFEHFLTTQDQHGDFKRLLQSVTAVVISYDIRPSFYWVVTGAIYLDPNNLWMTQLQRDTINEAPDYRSSFGNDLQFLMPWRYTKDNAYAYPLYESYERTDRTIDDFAPRLASLLYHELAHANDFFPRSIHAQLQGPTLLDDYYERSGANALISDQLTTRYPLQSDEMYDLAQVSFQGKAASATQKAYMPSDIVPFFSTDTAIDYYAYSTSREDAAMMFEAAFMGYRYNLERDMAITDNPENATSSSITVEWGMRNRISDPSLHERATYVVEQMMPEIDSDLLFNQLPKVVMMTPGLSWLDNLAISPVSAAQLMGLQSVEHHENSSHSHQPMIDYPLQLSGDEHKTILIKQ